MRISALVLVAISLAGCLSDDIPTDGECTGADCPPGGGNGGSGGNNSNDLGTDTDLPSPQPSASPDPITDSPLPADRSIPGSGGRWNTQSAPVGVRGGIPSQGWPIYQTLTPSGGDDAPAIRNALIAAPNNSVVKLSAGTFKISSAISNIIRSGVALRGAGPTQTKLDINGQQIIFGNYNDWQGTGQNFFSRATKLPIATGATRGSSSITVSAAVDASRLGSLMHVSQLNGTYPSHAAPVMNLVVTGQGNSDSGGHANPTADRDRNNSRNMQQMVRITSISSDGKTLGFEPPLFFDYSASPEIAIAYQTSSFVGIEDMKLANVGAATQHDLVSFYFVESGWMKNLEIANARTAFFVFASLNCEVRDSYVHDVFQNSWVNGSDNGYGQVAISSSSLFENNILERMLAPLIFAGSSGNVIAYNYILNLRSSYPDQIAAAININHGGYDMYNLLEGNVSPQMSADDYYGSSGFNASYRNHFTGTDTHNTCDQRAISIDSRQLYYSFFGNVLGMPSVVTNTVNDCGGTYSTASKTQSYEPPGNYNYTTPLLYRFGFTMMGAPCCGPMSDPKASALRGGNYDTATSSVVWNSNAPDSANTYVAPMTLPPSLFRSAKPGWFGTTPWPAIGPDVSGGNSALAGHVHDIPAKRCYTQRNLAAAGTFDPSACYY